jgi:hypothetical protein
MGLQVFITILMECIDLKCSQALYEQHCQHHIISPAKTGDSNLRTQGHKFVLSQCQYDMYSLLFLNVWIMFVILTNDNGLTVVLSFI